MKRLPVLVSFLMLLLTAANLRAQWSGNMEASGGFGMIEGLRGQIMPTEGKYLHHWLAQGNARLTYKIPTFTWESSLTGSYESNDKDYFNATLVGDRDNPISLDGLISLSHEAPMSLQYRSDLTWTPSPGRKGKAWFQYRFTHEDSEKANVEFSLQSHSGYYAEEPCYYNHVFETGINHSRDLGGTRRRLIGELVYGHTDWRQTTQYITVHMVDSETDRWADMYRLTPHRYTDRISGVLHFADSVATGPVKVLLDPGMRVNASRAINENSGATAELDENLDTNHPVWRDSVELRERFNFLSLDIQPYLTADLKADKISIHANYALSVYARELNDSTHTQGFRFKKPYVIGDGSVTWNMAKYHKLTFTNRLSVIHPTYLQVCWFDRSGGYIDRLYRGNPDLKSTYSSSFDLKYRFSYKRFELEGSVKYGSINDQIVQTWYREEIDGRSYRVFTWVNGSYTKSVGTTEHLGWKGKVLTGGLDFSYNHSFLRFTEEDKVVKTSDWSLRANVGINMGKGWNITADAKYQSQVSSFFELFGQYCIVNAKIKKSFKNLTLYLEGRHLADTPQDVRIESDDGSQVWRERTYGNRRLIVLGCSWKF